MELFYHYPGGLSFLETVPVHFLTVTVVTRLEHFIKISCQQHRGPRHDQSSTLSTHCSATG